MYVRGWLGAACAVLLLSLGSLAVAQTRSNPDISVTGDIRGKIADRPEDLGLEQKTVYELHEVELAVQGYLNPYARADVFLAWHDDEAHVEEAYVTFERGLPWGLSVRAGRYLLGFGRLNLLHPHAWSFIERPLVHEVYLGDHGFVDDGLSLRWLLPISSLYVELSADLLRGSALAGGPHHDAHEENHEHAGRNRLPAAGYHQHDDEETDDIPPDKGFLSHLSVVGATGDFAETAGGLSFAYGHHDPGENLEQMLLGVDLKHKYKPSRYTSLTLMAEAIVNRREMAEEHHDHEEENGHEDEGGEEGSQFKSFFGAYAFIDYQFKQRYNIGAKFDYYEPLPDKGNAVAQIQAFVGFAPVEETTLLRLTGYYRKPSAGEGVYGALVQLIFSLGPHSPHYF